MSAPTPTLATVVQLWTVQRLVSVTARVRVSTVLVAGVGILALLAALAGGASYLATMALLGWVGERGLASSVAAPLLALGLAAAATWIGVGAAVAERFSDRRFAVSASPVRQLWIALDCPLPTVILGERLVEQGARLVLGGAVLLGAAVGTARVSVAAGAAVAVAVVTLLAAEVWVQVVALTSARADLHGRQRPGVRELYWAALGVALGCVVGLGMRGMGGASATGETTTDDVDLGAVIAVGELVLWLALAAAGVAAVTALVVGVLVWRGLRRSAIDVPLAGFDDPQSLAGRWVIGRRHGPRQDPASFVAFGSGSLHVHPVVQRAFRGLLLVVAALGTARVVAGRSLLDPGSSVLPVELLTTIGAATATAGIAGLVTILAVMSSGQEARLWQYRTLWELGCSARSLWWGHVVGALVQLIGFTALSMAWTSILLGRLFWEAIFVAAVVPLSDYLAESALARPTDVVGDRRSTSSAMGLLQVGLSIPSIVLVAAGGWWSLLLPVHTALLAAGGYLCFYQRLTTLPRTVARVA